MNVKLTDSLKLRETTIIALSAVILFIVVFGCVISYEFGKSACRPESAYEPALNLDGVKDDQLVDNYLKLEEHKIYSLCLFLISCGVAIGLILHGFPFRFDFRRSTVYNEYSEDDEDDEDDEGDEGD